LELLRPPDPPVLLLLGCYRSEDADSSPCLRILLHPADNAFANLDRRELAVEGLQQDDAQKLACALLGEASAHASMQVATIARESRGSPFFVYELAQYLQVTSRGNTDSSATGRIALDDVLWARIQRLPEPFRKLLEI